MTADSEVEESTEIKLAILASLSGCEDNEILLETLLDCEGDVSKASEILSNSTTATLEPPTKKRKASAALGYQSSLSSFAIGRQSSPKKQLTKKGKTLHLYSSPDVAAHTPCSIVHNFLDKHQADALLNELLIESNSYGRVTFKIFENTVTSPHTYCFYDDNKNGHEQHDTDYLYNGGRVADIRRTPPHMRNVSKLVQDAVNKEIKERIRTHYPNQEKLKYQSPEEWVPNTSFVNCYDGAKESVGYHSDQLTYLGPRAVIGSLSLGVAREFRIRRIIPRNTKFEPDDRIARKANEDRADTEGQISIHLPHNSLLVMHAEMQEEWKHSIAPAQTIDPHPIAKNKRLNITYRYYRPSLHPSKTPKCNCGVSTVLRCVQKQTDTRGRYMWQCHSDQGKSSCNFFEWAQFDDDGEPKWTRHSTSVSQGAQEST